MSLQLLTGKTSIAFIKVFITPLFSYVIRNKIANTWIIKKNTKDRYNFRNNSECSFVSNQFTPIGTSMVANFPQLSP